MVKVVKIWKGDLMMRSKRLAKNKDLQKKVLCSLLAASFMSVCISGGDVWAANGDLAAQGIETTYTSADAVGTPKIIGGWDIYNGNLPVLDHTGKTTSVTISSGKFDELIGGNHIKQPGKDTYNVTIGNTVVRMDGGEVDYVIGGSKANNSDQTTLTTGNTNVFINNGTVNSMVIGGSYIKATGNPGGGTPAVTTANTSNTNVTITGGTVNGDIYGGSVADNYGTVQTDGKPQLHVSDVKTNVNVNGGTVNGNVYAGGAAFGTGSIAAVQNARIFIVDSTVNGNVLAVGQAANGGVSTVSGNVNIDIKDTTVNGVIYLENEKQNLVADDLTVTNAALAGTSARYKGVSLNDGAEAKFTGEKTTISIDSNIASAEVAGIQLFNGTKATFSADETVIDVKSIGKSGCWGFGILLNGKGNTAIFDGGDVTIKNYQEKYTSQTVTAKSESTIAFNNIGDIVISAESPYGVTAVDNQGSITFNNQGDVDISGTIVPSDKTGKTNVIGIQSGTDGAATVVTDKVQNFNITLTGAGVDNDGTSYSSGTSAIYLWKDVTADINSKTFNITMNIDEDTTTDIPGQHTSKIAYGLQPDGGRINVGTNTETNIIINEGLGIGYGVYANNDSSVSILGDTNISINARDGAYALYANALYWGEDSNKKPTLLQGTNGGEITVGSAGKNVNLTGDVKVDGGSVSNHGNVTINGQLLVKADGASSEYTSIGESLRINAGSDSAVQIENSSQKNVSNVLNFNSKNTELSSSGSSYISAVNILNNNQPDVTASNTVNFRGDTTKITATATDGKAQGVRIGESNFGSGKLTTDINFGATNTSINVKGNVVAGDYYDQVAGIWEGKGSYKGDVATNIAFNGKANIDVYSQGGNAYGIFVEHGSEIGTTIIDFNDNTVINAQNANGSGEAVYISGNGVAVNFNKAQKKGVAVDIIGDITAANNAKITLAGDTNIVRGILTASSGSVVLGGSDKATYNADKFITTGTGTITVSGGTLEINDLATNTDRYTLVDNSLIVQGKGLLSAASDNVFDKNDSVKIKAAVDDKVLFSGGKLAISDDGYTLADSKNYSEALKTADSNAAKTTIVMTGNLQLPSDTSAVKVEDLANTGAVHTNVSGNVAGNTLTLGDFSSGTVANNDLGVKDLQFSNSDGSAVSVSIGSNNALTLVGDGSGDLLKGTAATGNAVSLGSASSAGTLNLGVAGVASGGALNADVAIGHADSQLNVEGGAFTVQKITAEQGTVAVGSGSSLATDSLTIGSSNDTKTAAIEAAGTLTVKELTLNKGTVAVTGAAVADKLTASADATISVGSSVAAGSLQATNVKLSGASVMLDPAWDAGGNQIAGASKAGLDFIGAVDGKLTVGQNSVLTLGETDTSKAEKVFTDTGLTWGADGITAALYIDTAQSIDSTNGGLKVDGSLTHESSNKVAAANTAYFAGQSLLMVDSSLLSGGGALTATSGTLTVAAGAKLYIKNAEADASYVVVSGFGNGTSAVNGWGTDTVDNLLLNKLVKVDASNTKFENGTYTVATTKVNASEALPGVALPNILNAMAQDTNSANAGIKYLSSAVSDLNSDAQAIAAVNGFAQGAENSGAAHSGTMAAFTIGDTIQSRMSLANDIAAPQGGKGKGASSGDNGSIWAQYIHNKDKVDNLGGISYDGQYNGVIIGGDFTPTGKYHSGVAFSYGDGSSTGSVSKNDFDFWGLSYYGSIKNDDTNVIFDAGYSKTSNDIKGAVAIDSDTKVLTLAVKGEKLINNGHGTSYVPYAGLRYLNVDGGSYNGTIGGAVASHYSNDKANIWMLPIGIGVHNETVTADGWKLRPMADVAYVWTFGDNNSAMDVTVPGVNATDRLGYDIMDSGFFVGKLGVEAEKGDWTYGLGYAYQKGSHAQNSKFMLNVTYSF